ncbi:hypothetical protein BC941DRAFT_453823 [Chlamydoabsidia padenii]|nr:hypothetical protein BC941DRAFT_453823 [Chlamydoabsidia padenii]
MTSFRVELNKFVLAHRIINEGENSVIKLINQIIQHIDQEHELMPSPYMAQKSLLQSYPIKVISGITGRGEFFPPTPANLSLKWWPMGVYKGAIDSDLILSTAISQRDTFQGPEVFGLDKRHLLGHGIAAQLLAMMGGHVNDEKHDGNGDLFLGVTKVGRLFEKMDKSIPYIPTSFDGSFRTPFGKNTCRAVDCIDILRFVVPAVFVPKIRDTAA